MTDSDMISRRRLTRLVTPAAVAGLLAALACGGGGAQDGSGPSEEAAERTAEASSAGEHTHDGGETHAHEGGEDQGHDGSGDHAHGSGTHTHAATDTLASGVELDVESGVWTGSATVLGIGDSVRVLVSVKGAEAGSRHSAELVAGSCDDPGAELASLTPLAAGSSGAGSSQTDVPASRLEGHAHGALRVTAGDGSAAACAPVHLASAGHAHGDE